MLNSLNAVGNSACVVFDRRAFGISRKHPFLDGNKRTSLVVAELSLELNSLELTASDAECVTTFLQLAAGDLTEDELAAWIAANSSPAH
jgi:death-on-curing protein